VWYVSDPVRLNGGPDQGISPSADCALYIVVSALRVETRSLEYAYCVGTAIPMSPGHTVRSRLAPSTRTESPTPTVAPLSHAEDGGGQARPWWEAIVLSCTVYAPAYQMRLRRSSLEEK
jgi:hypothetical protein